MPTPISDAQIRSQTLILVKRETALDSLTVDQLDGTFFTNLAEGPAVKQAQFIAIVVALRAEFADNGFTLPESKYPELMASGVEFIVQSINNELADEPVVAADLRPRGPIESPRIPVPVAEAAFRKPVAIKANEKKSAPKTKRRKRGVSLLDYLKKHKLLDVLGEYKDKDGHLNVSMHSSGKAIVLEWNSIFGCVNGVLIEDDLDSSNDPENPVTRDKATRKIAEGEFVAECGTAERYNLVAEFTYEGTKKRPVDCALKVCPLDDDDCPEHTGAVIGNDGAILFYTNLKNKKIDALEEQIWPYSGKPDVKASWASNLFRRLI